MVSNLVEVDHANEGLERVDSRQFHRAIEQLGLEARHLERNYAIQHGSVCEFEFENWVSLLEIFEQGRHNNLEADVSSGRNMPYC